MSRIFATLFPSARQAHLQKDVGMIPAVMCRDQGYRSVLVAADPSLQGGRYLEIHLLKQAGLLPALAYLWRHSRDIAVLQLYHHSYTSMLLGALYRLRHRKGVLYLKLDINKEYLLKLFYGRNRRWHTGLWNFFFRYMAGVVSCESRETLQLLQERYRDSPRCLYYLPNGVDDQAIAAAGIVPRSFDAKEQLMICVGRIGAAEKNHEFLLEVVAALEMNSWRFVFIGPVTDAFRHQVVALLQQHPSLNGRVVLTGNIEDPYILWDWYDRAKVFCLSSVQEGFPLVLAEAMYFGNYVISTPVSSVAEILDQGQLGAIADSVAVFRDMLQRIIADDTFIRPAAAAAAAKAGREYTWTSVAAQLEQHIEAYRQAQHI